MRKKTDRLEERNHNPALIPASKTNPATNNLDAGKRKTPFSRSRRGSMFRHCFVDRGLAAAAPGNQSRF
jgi:hypothetical protein